MEKIIKNCEIATICQNETNGQFLLKSNNFFNVNDCITNFSFYKKSIYPTYLTVQINKEEHITLNPEFLQYINHSCNPNVFFDVENFKLIAIRPISVNDELTFFYPSTEWEMIQPFDCLCQTESCLQIIKGAKYLSKSNLKKYRLSTFILNTKLNTEKFIHS